MKCSVSTDYSNFCSIKAVIYRSREHYSKQNITVVLPSELKKIVVRYSRVSTIQYSTDQFNTIQYNTIQYNTTQHNTQHTTQQSKLQ